MLNKYLKQNNSYNIKRLKKFTAIIIILISVSFLTCACTKKENEEFGYYPSSTMLSKTVTDNTTKTIEPAQQNTSGKMITYDVTLTGRSDPFMPYEEYKLFEQARQEAIREAGAHNAEIAKIKRLQGVSYREKDDISPYSFNLPVPPTSLAGKDTTANKITRTKVVGIMYNEQSPTAIINVDNQDYLVRPGDKIIGQEYIVQKINKNWVTVNLGSNVYSAAIGEEFSKDEIVKYQNDIYNLENRFGGRKG